VWTPGTNYPTAANSSHIWSFSSGWFSHSISCARPIIWKMRILQDTNGCCPTKKASTTVAWECYLRVEAGRCWEYRTPGRMRPENVAWEKELYWRGPPQTYHGTKNDIMSTSPVKVVMLSYIHVLPFITTSVVNLYYWLLRWGSSERVSNVM